MTIGQIPRKNDMKNLQVTTNSFDSSLNQGTIVLRLKANAMDILTDLDAISDFRKVLDAVDDAPSLSGYAQIHDGEWDSHTDIKTLSRLVYEEDKQIIRHGHFYDYQHDLLVARFRNTIGYYLIKLIDFSKPTVAAFSKTISAEYLGLALTFDYRLATSDATISFDNVRTGLPASPGVTYLMPRYIGIGRTMAFANQGATISAKEALELGLVSEIVEEDRDLTEICVGYMQGLTNRNRDVLKFNRQHILPSRNDVRTAIDRYCDAFSKAIIK